MIAAGGIADAETAAAARAAGAAAVAVGTRFVASDESTAHGVWKDAPRRRLGRRHGDDGRVRHRLARRAASRAAQLDVPRVGGGGLAAARVAAGRGRGPRHVPGRAAAALLGRVAGPGRRGGDYEPLCQYAGEGVEPDRGDPPGRRDRRRLLASRSATGDAPYCHGSISFWVRPALTVRKATLRALRDVLSLITQSLARRLRAYRCMRRPKCVHVPREAIALAVPHAR